MNREAVAAINREVSSLAAAINAPDAGEGFAVSSENEAVPVAAVMKEAGGGRYVFAVAMREGQTRATFTVPGRATTVEVINENRTLPVSGGRFADLFSDYDVHLYRIR